MDNPCTECPKRNIICITEQLFMDCHPYNEFEQALLNKLINNKELPKPKKRRWYHVGILQAH